MKMLGNRNLEKDANSLGVLLAPFTRVSDTEIQTPGNIRVGGEIYTNGFADYSSTATINGWASFTNKKIYYKKLGKLVIIYFFIDGQSNSTFTSFTLPYTLNSLIPLYGLVRIADTGIYDVGLLEIFANTNIARFYKNAGYGSWTASGTKYISGWFIYQTG